MENTYVNELYLEYILANSAAPVLANKKPAGLMTIWKYHLSDSNFIGYCKSGTSELLNGSHLEVLLETRLYYLIFCYREEQLIDELEKNKNSVMLLEYSSLTSVQQKINLLREKIKLYYSLGKDFPHEIGLFLGYPVWDVEGFIKHKGQQYKMCGYWKVYDDIPGALSKFEEYDWLKKEALERFYKDCWRNNQKI